MDKQFKQLLEDVKYYNSKGNTDRAKIVLDELKQKHPDDARVIFSEALYYDRLGPYDDKIKALEKLKELIDNNAKNKDAAMYEYLRIISYMKIKKEEVKDYFNYLVKINYKNNGVYFYYGRYLEGQGLYEKAKEMYVISKDLGFRKAEQRLANLEQLDNYDINNVKNDNLFSLELSGEQLFGENKYEELKQLLDDYVNKNDTIHNFSILYYIFKSYIAIGYVEDAKNLYYNNYKYINEDFARYFIEARIDLCDEKYEEAIEKFSKVISYDRALISISYYYLAQIADINKQYNLEREYYIKMKDVSEKPEYPCMKLAEMDIHEGKYEDAKCKLNALSDEFVQKNELTVTQLKAMVNLPLSDKYSGCYSVKQIINYSELETYNHVKKHTEEYEENERVSVFNKDIDLEKLVSNIREMISYLEEDYRDIFSHYIIEYNKIGYAHDREANFLEVVVIPNTNKIITMFPIFSNNIFVPNKVVEEEVKIKRKSQIDKFYERYGK